MAPRLGRAASAPPLRDSCNQMQRSVELRNLCRQGTAKDCFLILANLYAVDGCICTARGFEPRGQVATILRHDGLPLVWQSAGVEAITFASRHRSDTGRIAQSSPGCQVAQQADVDMPGTALGQEGIHRAARYGQTAWVCRGRRQARVSCGPARTA